MLSLLFVVLSFAVPVQAQQPDLDRVLARASDYVSKYEQELGNLIATEEYIQNAQWKNMQAAF